MRSRLLWLSGRWCGAVAVAGDVPELPAVLVRTVAVPLDLLPAAVRARVVISRCQRPGVR